ncbi:hypothetical protein NQZ68_020014 [Dissostichus eleginoides]|nr:hypothetical protein NQZ68_020014 [Dissostichus eleginoides]
MGMPGSAPKRFVQHRWLSAYDYAISTQRQLPAYKVLYYCFMDKEDKALYKDPLKQLLANHNVNEKAQAEIQFFQEDLCRKFVRGHSQAGFELKKLTYLMSYQLPPDADTHQEILQYSVNQTLPTFREGDDVVSWWASVFEMGKISRPVSRCKSCHFHLPWSLGGILINLMGDIIDPRSTSMNIATCSAIQTVKYTQSPANRVL